MADAHGHGGGGHAGGHKKKDSHGSSDGVSGWALAGAAILAIILLVLFMNGTLGSPSVPYEY